MGQALCAIADSPLPPFQNGQSLEPDFLGSSCYLAGVGVIRGQVNYFQLARNMTIASASGLQDNMMQAETNSGYVPSTSAATFSAISWPVKAKSPALAGRFMFCRFSI